MEDIYVYTYIYISSTQIQRTVGSSHAFENATVVTILNFTAPAISQSAEEVNELLSAAGTPVQSGVVVSGQCRLCVINMYDVSALSTATCATLARADRPVTKHCDYHAVIHVVRYLI